MTIKTWLQINQKSQTLIYLLSILYVCIIVYLDYLSGAEITLSIFYLPAIFVFSWFGTKLYGILASLLCTTFVLIGDLYSGYHFTNMLAPYWSAVALLSILIAVSIITNILKHTLESQKNQMVKLQEANNEIQRLADAKTEVLMENARMQESSRVKNVFLTNMSHELRTPLNGIIGLSELMYTEEASKFSIEPREYLSDIIANAHHLLRIIDDILTLTDVEAGVLKFKPERVDVRVLINEIGNVFNPAITEKNIRFSTEIDPSLQFIMVDPVRFKQILYNYLSNAIKFTPLGGEIKVSLSSEDHYQIRLNITDTGIGIAQDEISKLFSEIKQLDSRINKIYQGVGVGLILTRYLVEAQGGKVGVQSTKGKGSTFYATLPLTV